MICPHCGRYLEDGVAFCIYCGQRLGKYADETAEASQTVNLSDNADAQGVTGAAADGQHAAAGAAAAGVAGAAAAAAAPVAPASAQEAAHAAASTRSTAPRPSVSGRGTRNAGRLHSDDEIAKRMNELDDGPSAKRGRKVVAGVLLAALAAGAIGVGANYVVPSILDNGGSSSTASQVTSSSSSDSSSATKSTSSKSDSKSTKSSKSSKSTKSSKSSQSASSGQSSSTTAKRGATVERANAEEETQTQAEQAAQAETVEAVPTTGEETTTGVVNTYTPPAPQQGQQISASPARGTASSFGQATATATSISPTEGGVSHGPELVLDGLAYTAWNTNLNGVGHSITLATSTDQAISGLNIMNGYNKISASGNDLYYANARAKEILVEYEGGSKVFTLQDLKGEYQKLNFDSSVNTYWVKITINSVYPGTMYDDCCISEIEVF